MSLERYFRKLPKHATPLPISWRPPPPKRPKRGPGRPRKKCPPVTVTVTIDDSDKESHSDPDESKGTESSMEKSETTELEVERTASAKRLYNTKQKRIIVAYAKQHSFAAATQKFSVPRSTIGRWMIDGYFERDTTKRGVKKGAGRPLTEIDEQLLIWVLENRDLHLSISIPLLQAKALELIGAGNPEFKASSGWTYKFLKRHSLVLHVKISMAQELPATLEERIQAFHCQIERLAEINKFEVVGNMDETPLYFDVVPGRVLDKKGKKKCGSTHHRK